MSDILNQLWQTAQDGFVQSHANDQVVPATVAPIDTSLKVGMSKRKSEDQSPSSSVDLAANGDKVNLGNSTETMGQGQGGNQSLVQQIIANGIGGN